VVYAIRESRRGLARTYPRSLRRCPFFFPFSFFSLRSCPRLLLMSRACARDVAKRRKKSVVSPGIPALAFLVFRGVDTRTGRCRITSPVPSRDLVLVTRKRCLPELLHCSVADLKRKGGKRRERICDPRRSNFTARSYYLAVPARIKHNCRICNAIAVCTIGS